MSRFVRVQRVEARKMNGAQWRKCDRVRQRDANDSDISSQACGCAHILSLQFFLVVVLRDLMATTKHTNKWQLSIATGQRIRGGFFAAPAVTFFPLECALGEGSSEDHYPFYHLRRPRKCLLFSPASVRLNSINDDHWMLQIAASSSLPAKYDREHMNYGKNCCLFRWNTEKFVDSFFDISSWNK